MQSFNTNLTKSKQIQKNGQVSDMVMTGYPPRVPSYWNNWWLDCVTARHNFQTVIKMSKRLH